MPTFPLQKTKANIAGYGEKAISDNTIRAEFSNGMSRTRAGSTKTPKLFTLTYSYITTAEKTELEEFEQEVLYGQDGFEWIKPTDSSSFVVKFNKPIMFTSMAVEGFWIAQIELKEKII